MEYEAEEAKRPCRQQRSSDNIKMKIPPFRETSSLDEYLEWVQRVEKIIEYQDHSEASKVKLAALEFIDYANMCWENVKAQRRCEGEEPMTTWCLIKRLMEKWFFP